MPLEELDNYLKGDKLIKVLIDKDCRIKRDIVPTDIDYHVRKPSAREYDDCCNEFWNVTPYVIKGLCRKEILFAIDHFNQIVRHELLRMISWKVGIETGFKLSVGKNYKFIERYISEDLWEKLCPPTGWIPMKTYGKHYFYAINCSGRYPVRWRKGFIMPIRSMIGI